MVNYNVDSNQVVENKMKLINVVCSDRSSLTQINYCNMSTCFTV